MRNQFKVEFYKLRTSVVWLLGLLFMAAVGFATGAIGMYNKYGFTEIYQAYAESLSDASLMFVLGIFAAMFVGYDFSTRTIHHELVSGASRLSIVVTRSLPAFVGAVALHFTLLLFSVLGLWSRLGYSIGDGSIFRDFSSVDLWWALTVALQIIALQSVFLMVSFIFTNLYSGIIGTVIVAFVMCNMLRNFVKAKAFAYSCFCLAQDNSPETLKISALYALAVIVISTAVSYAVFRKKEI